MEPFNRTNTELRLGKIYDYILKHKGTLPEDIEEKIYKRLGNDLEIRTYHQTDLQSIEGVSYSNGRTFIPDGFISQSQNGEAYEAAGTKFNPETQADKFWKEHDKILAGKNPDDEYRHPEGDYFHLILDKTVASDERIIINLASQQEALQLCIDLASGCKSIISEVKFWAKTPPEPEKALKCDKVVVYYAKGTGNVHRSTLLGAIQHIITTRGLHPVDCLSAFYHKEAPGIGYGIELGNPSFTTRITATILDIVTGKTPLPAPVAFDGKAADRADFISQCYTAVTAAI